MLAARSWDPSFPSSTRGTIYLWKRVTLAVETAQTLVPKNQFMEVRYEDLLKDTAGALLKLADFLQLRWSQAEIEVAIATNFASQEPSAWTSLVLRGEARDKIGNKVIEPRGFKRRDTAKNWKTDLGWFQKLQVWWIAREEMAQYGYPWRYPW